MTYANKTFYEGDFVLGVKKGKGFYGLANGDTYEGEFDNGVFHGQGG